MDGTLFTLIEKVIVFHLNFLRLAMNVLHFVLFAKKWPKSHKMLVKGFLLFWWIFWKLCLFCLCVEWYFWKCAYCIHKTHSLYFSPYNTSVTKWVLIFPPSMYCI